MNREEGFSLSKPWKPLNSMTQFQDTNFETSLDIYELACSGITAQPI
jgi:hypothetical protein